MPDKMLHSVTTTNAQTEDTTTWTQVGPDKVEVWEAATYPGTDSSSVLARTITLAQALAEIAKLGGAS